MLVNHPNITEKNYRKLTLLLSKNSCSYCCKDTISEKILWFRESKEGDVNPEKTDDFERWFKQQPELLEKYDQVTVVHQNQYNAFVPVALFSEDFLGSYLQFSNQVFESEQFAYDDLRNYEMKNVYVPFSGANDVLIENFGEFEFKHSSTTLVSGLLDTSKNIEERQVFAIINTDHFDLVIVQNQKLLLYNSFEFRTTEDFLYYLLFAAEQLGLNPEQFKLTLLGSVKQDDALFQAAYKYVRNISLFEPEIHKNSADFSSEEVRKHYILFNA